MKNNNKYRRSVISMLMVVLLVALSSTTIFAAQVDYKTSSVKLNPSVVASASDNDTYKEAAADAAEQIRNLKTNVDISKYNISTENFAAFYTAVLYNNPDLFYISPQNANCAYYTPSQVIFLKPVYLYSNAEILEKKEKFNKA